MGTFTQILRAGKKKGGGGVKAQEGKERAISTPVCDGMQRDQQRTSKQKHENGWMGGGVGVGGGTADLCCRDTYGQRKPRHFSSHSNRSADLHASTTARPPALCGGKLHQSMPHMDLMFRSGPI